jgi:probable rRNA maturation factor
MIEINNMTANAVDKTFLKQVVKKVLENENKKEMSLSIAFVGEGRMRKLNKKYRKKNRATDVLSFGEISNFRMPARQVPISRLSGRQADFIRGLGEVIICLREVKKSAKRRNLTFREEIARVLIHGILHLLGYEHERSQKAAKEMEEKEYYYLSEALKL